MSDITVDNIQIEIEATADKAISSINKLKNALNGMKNATSNLDFSGLRRMVTALNSMSISQDNANGLKAMGDGIRSISTSAKNLASLDTGKLNEVADALSKIGQSMQGIGSNNNIRIRVDSEGMKKISESSVDANVAQNMQNAANAADQLGNATQTVSMGMERLSMAEGEVTSTTQMTYQAWQNFINALGSTGGSSEANAVIDDLIAKMREYQQTISDMQTGKTPFDFDKFSEATQGLDVAKERMEEVKKVAEGMPKTVGDVANEFQKVGETAQKSGLSGFGSALQDVGQYLTAVLPAGEAAEGGLLMVAAGLEAVEAAIPIIGLVIAGVKAIGKAATAVAGAIQNEIQQDVTFVSDLIRSKIEEIQGKMETIGKFMGNVFDGIKKKIGESTGIFDDIQKKLQSFLRLFTFMALRRLITSVFSGLQEGFNLLAQYSDMIGSKFNQNVSLIVADLQWLSNSMVAAFEPILNVITPILDFLISKLVEAINAINQFFSALTGSATWTRAKRNVQNYAGSLNQGTQAAQKMKKAIDDLTVGIDELNILRQEDDTSPSGGGGAGGGAGAGDFFETEEVSQEWKDFAEMVKKAWEDADFTEVGKYIGDKLAEALANIPWDEIKKTAHKLGKSLATLINGFIQGEFDGKSVSTWIGNTLGEAINTAVTFVAAFVENIDASGLGRAFTDLIDGALNAIDWELIKRTLKNIGLKVAQFLNSVFGNYSTFAEAGTAFKNVINGIIDGALTFVKTFDFREFGYAVGLGLHAAFDGINFKDAAETITTAINGLFEAIDTAVKTANLPDIAAQITAGINHGLETINWSEIQQHAESVGSELGKTVETFFNPETKVNWSELGHNLVRGITTMFKSLGAFLDEVDFDDVATALVDYLNGAIDEFNANIPTYQKTINKLIDGVNTIVTKVINDVKWADLMMGIGDLLAGINWGQIFDTVFKVVSGCFTFKAMFAGVSFVSIGLGIAKDLLSGLLDGVGTIGTIMGIPFAKEMAEVGKQALSQITAAIEDEDKKAQKAAEDLGKNVTNSIQDPDRGNLNAESGADVMKKFLKDGVTEETAKQAPKVGEQTEEVGKSATKGFGDGIDKSKQTNAFSKIATFCSDAIKEVIDPAKGNINAEKFAQIAGTTTSGFGKGISETYDEAGRSIKSWVADIKKKFNGEEGSINAATFGGYAKFDTVDPYNSKIDELKGTSETPMGNWAGKIKDFFTNASYGAINKTTFDNYASDSTSGYNTGVATRETNSQTPVTSWAGKIKDYFTNMTYGAINRSTFDTYASDSTSGYNSGISTREGFSNSPMTGWASWIKTYFTGAAYGNINKTQFGTYGADSVSGYNKGVTDNTSSVKQPMTNLASTAHDAMSNWNGGIKSAFETIGENIIKGVIEGLANQTLIGQLLSAAASLIASAFGAMEHEAEEHSPSKRAERVAINIDKGLINGLENAKGQVISAASSVVDSMMSVMEVTPRVSVDTSAVRNFTPNLGTEFANATMSHRIQSEMALASAIQVDGSRVSDGIRAVIQEEISPLLTNIDTNTQRQADKKEVVNVEIGRKTVKDAVVSQTSADGFSFTPSFA